MKVFVAEKCGFCQGVRNAISLAEETLADKKVVYSFGPIIHNSDVVERLASQGLMTVSSVDEVPGGTVLIRSHGATQKQIKQIKDRGLEIVDATCVLVKRVQSIARQLEEEGYTLVIIGDEGHPEIQAVMGYAHKGVVVGDVDALDRLKDHKKLGIICQTTQSLEHFGEMVSAIIERGFTEIKVINTLCKEATKRQQSAVELCQKVDIMFVLGGKHSANTKKLAELCKKYNNNTFHLQNSSELDPQVVAGLSVAGVMAGASTPDWVINEFVEYLKKL